MIRSRPTGLSPPVWFLKMSDALLRQGEPEAMQMSQKAMLALEDGTVFEGWSIGYPGEIGGGLVFNTSMTGYLEILTDPSYKGQIVVMTYPPR